MAASDFTILLVDDDKAFRDELKEGLRELGYTVAAIESAQHAIKFIGLQPWSWAPSLLLTDLVMDGMGGYQFMRQFTELYKSRNIPIMVVSRLLSAEDISEADIAGACYYFGKPVEASKIKEQIERVVATKLEKKPIAFGMDLGQKGRLQRLITQSR